MQPIKVECNGKPTNLLVDISVSNPQKIRLMAYNENRPNTFYMNRVQTVNGKAQFEIRMPQNCDVVDVKCIGENGTAEISNLKQVKLNQYYNCIDSTVLSFVKFAQEFSERLSTLHIGTYFSDDKKYRIDLFNDITQNGTVIPTPARISNINGRMEVSKRKFLEYSVPMRMAILLHEFSHYNLNRVQQDEIEADLNALRIYLGLGYPIIEAHNSFLNVFKKTPSNQNKERYQYIKYYIDNFDKIKYGACI